MRLFLQAEFDKLLLAALILFALGALLWLVHANLANQTAAQALTWIEKSIDVLTGALLGIVTGRATAKSE